VPARALQESSQAVRRLVAAAPGRAEGSQSPGPESEALPSPASFHIYHELGKNPHLAKPQALPALEQVLTGEPPLVRLGLVQALRSPPDSPVAAAVLARRAVFDTSAEVRQGAVVGLRFLSARDYLPHLLNGLRYPWAPANYHAAEALVALGTEAAVADLVRLLGAPDPCAPFEIDEGVTKVLAVRELVRVNHHGSCLLCHAPSFSANDLVRGPVPSPLRPLPTRAPYYGDRGGSGDLFVRADITYLRQDFSEVQPVEHAGPWPKRQRFDFLVRVRRLAEDEAQAWRGRERDAGPPPLPASRQAVLFALRQLTGVGGGFTAASWEQALAARPRPVEPK
jgi:hypothetical protein